jgi:RNA polymerase sigma factor (sigma-70 family)
MSSGSQYKHTWSVDAENIMKMIQAGDPQGEEQLYGIFTRGLRYLAIRKLGYEQADECVHDTFIALAQKIKQGAIREPAALLGYARTILERKILEIHSERRKWRVDVDFEVLANTTADHAPNPEKLYEAEARIQVMKHALRQLRPKEREILERFYLEGQNPDQICREMNLTSTQFRLLKSRSKIKLEQYTTTFWNGTGQTGAAERAECALVH